MDAIFEQAIKASRERQIKSEENARLAEETRVAENVAWTVRMMVKIGIPEDQIMIKGSRVMAAERDFGSYHDSYSYSHHLVLHGNCPRCGCPTSSQDIESLADLGDQLQEFVPSHIHQCEYPVREQEVAQHAESTLTEKVAQLIRLMDEIRQEFWDEKESD